MATRRRNRRDRRIIVPPVRLDQAPVPVVTNAYYNETNSTFYLAIAKPAEWTNLATVTDTVFAYYQAAPPDGVITLFAADGYEYADETLAFSVESTPASISGIMGWLYLFDPGTTRQPILIDLSQIRLGDPVT
jgi:hypothetical protein